MAKVLDGSLKKGDSLQNKKYVIDKVIGSGGFGITYLAHFVYLDTKVAIKEFFWSGHSIRNNNSNTISPQSISIEKYDDLKSKFMDEAKTLSKFRHPNIVKVFDIFEENDTSYFVMEYIDGETLHGLIKKKKKIPYFETINYIAQISEAVQEVHKQGLLHRDIKPENIRFWHSPTVCPRQNHVAYSDGNSGVCPN